MNVPAVGNGWLRTRVGDPTADGVCVRWKPKPHPEFGLIAEHGPDVPCCFFLAFSYEVQTAASYCAGAEPQQITPPLKTWHSRN